MATTGGYIITYTVVAHCRNNQRSIGKKHGYLALAIINESPDFFKKYPKIVIRLLQVSTRRCYDTEVELSLVQCYIHNQLAPAGSLLL